MLYHFPNAVDLELSDRRPTTDQESIELRIAGATFHDRYTERLSDTDLRKAIYVYATADTVVGRLAEPEVRFLQDNEATVIPGEGANHYLPWLWTRRSSTGSTTHCRNNPDQATPPPCSAHQGPTREPPRTTIARNENI